jgi:hypothetical protein
MRECICCGLRSTSVTRSPKYVAVISGRIFEYYCDQHRNQKPWNAFLIPLDVFDKGDEEIDRWKSEQRNRKSRRKNATTKKTSVQA